MHKGENRKKAVKRAGKSSAYLLLTLLLAAVIILSSMFCVSRLIKNRENALLSGKGSIKQDAPVSGGLKNKKGEKIVLAPEEIQAVMKNWGRRTELVVHEPVEGQIAMSEAVKAVDDWLVKMGISEGILSGNSTVRSSLNIARIKGEKPEILSPIYSFWEVTVNGDEMSGEFYVNAVTGQIYEAYLTLLSEPEGVTKDQLLKSFIRLAGLKPEEQKKSESLEEIIRQGAVSGALVSAEIFNMQGLLEYTEAVKSGIEAVVEGGVTDMEPDVCFSEPGPEGEENWSLETGIASSSMKARASCLHSWRYEGSGMASGESDAYAAKQIAVNQAEAEYVFVLYTKE